MSYLKFVYSYFIIIIKLVLKANYFLYDFISEFYWVCFIMFILLHWQGENYDFISEFYWVCFIMFILLHWQGENYPDIRHSVPTFP